jgi:hypothetical protein
MLATADACRIRMVGHVPKTYLYCLLPVLILMLKLVYLDSVAVQQNTNIVSDVQK